VPFTTPVRLKISQDWVNDLPLKFLWTVDFFPREGGNMSVVGNNVSKIVGDYQPNSWIVNPNIFEDHSDKSLQLGYLLAQNISLPSEQFAIGTEPLERSGGFVAGYFGGQRSSYGSEQKVDITFLETNKDIFDYFIKPWIVASSYKGLVEDGEDDIKCTIAVTYYSRAKDYYTDKWRSSFDPLRPRVDFAPRKQYIFYDCVPTNVEGDKMSYGELSIGDLTRTTSFVFSYYNIKDLSNV
jgi:hypothetical protein